MVIDPIGLNSREEALILWIAIILIFVLFKENTRKLFKVFLDKKILLVLSLAIVYICAELLVLSWVHLMDRTLIKEAVFWLFGSAFIILVNINKASLVNRYFSKMIIDSLKFITVVAFIVNFYTFNFFVEIMLTPLIFFIMTMSMIAALEEKFALVKKIMDLTLVIIGIIILVHVFVSLINSYSDLATLNNLRAFILPPALTVLYVPFIYFVALFMTYELLFVRLKSLLHHEKSLIRPVKKKIILSCHINLGRLNKFSSIYANKLLNVKNRNDVNDFFTSLN